MRNQRRPGLGRVVEGEQRHAEEGAHRRTHGLRARRICAPVRQRDKGRTERVRSPDQRADVARIAHAPERETDRRQRRLPEIATPEDADHARRMAERRHLGERGRVDVVAGDEQFDRLDPGAARRIDEILALAHEQPELLPLPRRREAPDELQLPVQSSHSPW